MLQLKRVVVFLDTLKKYIETWRDARSTEKEQEKTEIMTAAQLMERLGKRVAGINLLEVEAYLKRSKVGGCNLKLNEVKDEICCRSRGKYLDTAINKRRRTQVRR